MISYTAQVKCKSWLEWDLNAIQVRMCSVLILLQNHPQRNMKRKFLTWFLTLPKSSVKVDSRWDLNAIQASMCSVSILLQNHPQRNMKRKFLTWFLTLPKSSVKVDLSETWTLSKRACAVFDSITEPSSEKHEEKISNMISYTAQVKCKSWLAVRLERYPSEDVQCFDSITEPSSEKHEEKISTLLTLALNHNFVEIWMYEKSLSSGLRYPAFVWRDPGIYVAK